MKNRKRMRIGELKREKKERKKRREEGRKKTGQNRGKNRVQRATRTRHARVHVTHACASVGRRQKGAYAWM